MTLSQIFCTIIEFIAAGAVIFCTLKEDKLIQFEEKIKARFFGGDLKK